MNNYLKYWKSSRLLESKRLQIYERNKNFLLSILSFYSFTSFMICEINWRAFAEGNSTLHNGTFELVNWFTYPLCGPIRPWLPGHGFILFYWSDGYVLAVDYCIPIAFFFWGAVIEYAFVYLRNKEEQALTPERQFDIVVQRLAKNLNRGELIDLETLLRSTVPSLKDDLSNYIEALNYYAEGSVDRALKVLMGNRSFERTLEEEKLLGRIELLAHCCMETNELGYGVMFYDRLNREISIESSGVVKVLRAIEARYCQRSEGALLNATRKRLEDAIGLLK